ncbi:MAG: hypothetical protein VSS75_012850 [Candidatus Parabeggiatoa sp.]|nr:hypothetical protein [Candidatus Parabeggiatoa sp.]
MKLILTKPCSQRKKTGGEKRCYICHQKQLETYMNNSLEILLTQKVTEFLKQHLD